MIAREVALQVLHDVFPAQGEPRMAQASLDYRLNRAQCDVRDRAFVTNLTFGAVKMRRMLDWLLAPYIGTRAKALPAAIGEILRLAVYELRYTGAAHHAVVSEWVGIAKRHGHRGTAGLVNAVLRSLLRDPERVPQRHEFDDDDDYLGALHSFPTWIVRRWRAAFGGDRLSEILAACNAPAQPAVTVNRTKQTRESVARDLALKGVGARESDLAQDSLLVDDGGSVRAEEAAAAGSWWLQSETSAMVVDVLNPQAGEAIADACSGRGNKALQIAARLDRDGSLTCIDRDARKNACLAQRASQANLPVATVTADAAAAEVAQSFDRVLLDAPCSGLGVLGRHPEARWRKAADDAERLAAVQHHLLSALSQRLFPGGALVYAVCSNDPRESSDVVDDIVETHNLRRGLLPARFEAFETARGDLNIPPGVEGRDGFYISRLERGL